MSFGRLIGCIFMLLSSLGCENYLRGTLGFDHPNSPPNDNNTPAFDPLLEFNLIAQSKNFSRYNDISKATASANFQKFLWVDYTDYWPEIYVFDRATGNVQNILHNEGRFSEIFYATISPNGQYALFLADEGLGNTSAFAVSTNGEGLSRLHPPLLDWTQNAANPGDVVMGLARYIKFTPDSSKVVFVGDVVTPGEVNIYSVNPDGSNLIRLNPALSAGTEVGWSGGSWTEFAQPFLISPNSQKVVYLADIGNPGYYNLFSVNIDGSNQTQVNPALGGGVDIYKDKYSSDAYLITPDSSRVIYLTNSSSIRELFIVDIDGSNNLKLNGPLTSGGRVNPGFILSPDGSKIAYTADQVVDNDIELFVVNIDGSGNLKLNPNLVAGGDVKYGDERGEALQFSPDSNYIIYAGDLVVDGTISLYSVKIDGTENTELATDAFGYPDCPDLFIGFSDNSHVLYGSDNSIFEATIGSPNSAVRWDPPGSSLYTLRNTYDTDASVQYDSNLKEVMFYGRVGTEEPAVYILDSHGNIKERLRLQIYKNISFGEFSFNISSSINNLLVKFSNWIIQAQNSLSLIVFSNKDNSSINLSYPSSGSVKSFFIQSNLIFFTSNHSPFGGTDLYKSNFDGSNMIRLNPVLPNSSRRVIDYKVYSESNLVLYRANQDGAFSWELFASSIEGTNNWQVHPDFSYVNGSVGKYDFSPEQGKVVYVANAEIGTKGEIFAINTDGSNNQKLNPAMTNANAYIFSFQLTSDGSQVVFYGDTDTDEANDLHVVNIDGSNPRKITPTLPVNVKGVSKFNFIDDNRIVFESDHLSSGRSELFITPLDAPLLQKISNFSVNTDLLLDWEVGPDRESILIHFLSLQAPFHKLLKMSLNGDIVFELTPEIEFDYLQYQFDSLGNIFVLERNLASGWSALTKYNPDGSLHTRLVPKSLGAQISSFFIDKSDRLFITSDLGTPEMHVYELR